MQKGVEVTARTIGMRKDGQTYVFRYAPGSENEVMDELARLADDEGVGLDWVDAATLSFEVTAHAATRCRSALWPMDELSE